jgi:DNA-binding beta-propeller fold protein YncE
MRTWTLAAALLGLAACSSEKVCPQGQAVCDNACTSILTDVTNCGACGVSCGFGGACSTGQCTCAAGLATCGGSCVDLASDPAHCGSCGQACAGAGPFCSTSAGATSCAATCSAGQTACDHACVDLASDRFHCGACGRFCGSNERCIDAECLSDIYLACANTDQIAEATLDLGAAGTTHTVGTLPLVLTWLGDRLYSANSGGGSVSELRFDLPAPNPVGVSRTFAIDTTSAFPDLEYVTGNGGLLYVSNASFGNLDILDAASGTVIAATPLDPTGLLGRISPAGIALANGKAYVALNGADTIAVVDVSLCQAAPPACGAGSDCSAHAGTACSNGGQCIPTACGQLRQPIALPASLASTTTGPTPYRLLQVGSRLYVTLQNLDRATFLPAGDGRLTAIDLVNDTLVQDGLGNPLSVVLTPAGSATPCLDPSELVAVGDVLYVTCGFVPFSGPGSTGMAIVKVSLASGTPVAEAIVPTQNALGSIASCGGVLYAGATDTGSVVRYDPATGTLSPPVALCPLSPQGKSFVADLTCRPGL